MELLIIFVVIGFGVITWLPFLNGTYAHDVVSGISHLVDSKRKDGFIFYKDTSAASIGHFFHLMLIIKIWGKYNTKAFYGFMCFYTTLSSLLLFYIMITLFNPFSAVLGSMLFSFYIVNPRFDGNWGCFEQLIPLPLFASILMLLTAPDPLSIWSLFLSGCFFGYGILIKQIVALYLPGFLIMTVAKSSLFYGSLIFLAGTLVINLLPLLYYWLKHNALRGYIVGIWLFQLPMTLAPKRYNKIYPRMNVRGTKNKEDIKAVLMHHFRSFFPMIFLSLTGIIIILVYNISLFHMGLFLCLLLSISTIFMRGTFFGHYWLNIVPWFALFAGFGLSEIIGSLFIYDMLPAGCLAGILAVIILFIDALYADRKFYTLSKDPYAFLRKAWGEPLVHKYKLWKKVGEYIKENTKEEDKILVCGFTPHIHFYADRNRFAKQLCLYPDDYLEIYNNEKGVLYENCINSIFNMNIVQKRENIFFREYPEIIVFSEGAVKIEAFEKLTGIKYTLEKAMGGIPIFRADPILTHLLAVYEKSEIDKIRDKIDQAHGAESMYEKDMNHTAHKLIDQLENAPENIDYLTKLCDILLSMKRYNTLVRMAQTLINDNFVGDHVKLALLNKVGETYFFQESYQEAEKVFRQVLVYDPCNKSALNNLGVVNSSIGKNQDAIQYFHKVLHIDPKNQDALVNLESLGIR